MLGRLPIKNLIAACLSLALAACSAASAERSADRTQAIAGAAKSLTPEGLARLQRGMGRGAMMLAARYDPAPHSDFWGRTDGWTSIALGKVPAFPFGQVGLAEAAELNALLPIDEADFAPAQPFFLRATGAERDRAVLCMTQAIYYEAALEPIEGQQAVAQTVINRVRHPDFPKSICGVVYQGADHPPGCQFSFTCDASLSRPPAEPYWTRCKTVALAALEGFVARDVGSATHYHADYVFPRWGPQMVKIVKLGQQIFYRFPGPAGAPEVLTGRYAGNELATSLDRPLQAALILAKNTAAGQPAPLGTIPIPGGVQVVSVAGARPILMIPASDAAGAGQDARAVVAPGQVIGGRRIPTMQEIAKINAQLPPLPVNDVPVATAGGDKQ